jgi:acyl carrier protein phosphodiesterase
MNYLAHTYLSFEEDEILFGNFIGDFVKGNQSEKLPANIWKGVMLHRAIDAFTDAHAATKESKSLIRSELNLASGIFVDMVYDHVLAKKWAEYSDVKLDEYSMRTYETIDKFEVFQPERFSQMFRYMKNDDWLSKYGNSYDMSRYLKGMSIRLKVDNNLNGSFKYFEKHQKDIEQHFKVLFDDLIKLSRNF